MVTLRLRCKVCDKERVVTRYDRFKPWQLVADVNNQQVVAHNITHYDINFDVWASLYDYFAMCSVHNIPRY